MKQISMLLLLSASTLNAMSRFRVKQVQKILGGNCLFVGYHEYQYRQALQEAKEFEKDFEKDFADRYKDSKNDFGIFFPTYPIIPNRVMNKIRWHRKFALMSRLMEFSEK